MEIKTHTLIEALNVVSSVSKDNLNKEEDNLVMFAFGQIIAESERCYISTLFDYELHELEECILPYDKLFTLLSAFKTDSTLSLQMEDKNILLELKKGSKKSNTKLAFYIDKEINYIDPPNKGWIPIPKDFINALKKCKVSLPTEALKVVLTSYGIKNNKITTSDDARASQFKMEDKFDSEFTLSNKVGQLIIDNQFSEYIINGNTIFFKNDDVFVTAPLGVEVYPELNEEIFHPENDIKLTTQDFIEALDRAVLFAEGLSDIDYVVSLKISKGNITMQATNKYGKNEESINLLSSNCPDKIMQVNPVYLSQALKILASKEIKIGITKENNLVFKENGFNHLIASYVE